MKRFVFKADGQESISIIHPVERAKIERERGVAFATEADYEAFIKERSQPRDGDGLKIAGAFRDLEEADLPADRTFRDAWEDSQPGSQVDISMIKAKDLALSALRLSRDKRLKELDGDELKFMGAGDNENLTAVRNKKQQLRDVTEPLKAYAVSGYNDAQMIADLKAMMVLDPSL